MRKNTIGLIGYGRFAKLLEKIICECLPQLNIRIYDRNQTVFTGRFYSLETVCSCEFLIPAVPISQIELVSEQIKRYLTKDTTIIDVASVKEYPVKVYKVHMPQLQLIATHPMFGPGNFTSKLPLKEQLLGLNLVIHNVSATPEQYRRVYGFFDSLRLNLIEISPSDHDRIAAKSQFVTLVTAFMLKNLNFPRSKIDTKSAQALKNVVDMITIDKSLLEDMYTYNKYCKGEFDKLMKSLQQIAENFNKKL